MLWVSTAQGDSVKLYDGRGKRFKRLIDPKEIMDENRLTLTEVLPKWAREKWYSIWIRWSLVISIWLICFQVVSQLLIYILDGSSSFYELDEFAIGSVIIGIFGGCLLMLIGRRWTWKSKAVAVCTLTHAGFCPNCGYIIGDTPAESDGCVPCSECGYAWRVEPVDS